MAEVYFTTFYVDALIQRLGGRAAPAVAIVAMLDERQRQDDQWGGPARDDEQRRVLDWLNLIQRQIRLAHMEGVDQDGHADDAGGYFDVARVKERLTKIAALALAGLESIDRKHARGEL